MQPKRHMTLSGHSSLPPAAMTTARSRSLWHFSVIVTESCDQTCSYCHFYRTMGRRPRHREIEPHLFERYLLLVRRFADLVDADVDLRLSGGEPLVLGARLFELTRRAYATSGIAPYVLTAGSRLSEEWIEDATDAGIKYVMVSIENPLSPDPGAPDPFAIMRRIARLSSPKLPLFPGVTIVRNEFFHRIHEICRIVFDEIGVLPSIQELNYQLYESPSDVELKHLYRNMKRVVREFAKYSSINMFAYVAPELCTVSFDREAYLMELSFDDRYGVDRDLSEVVGAVITKSRENYPELQCRNEMCEWYSGCRYVKWLWRAPSVGVSREQKQRDYCRYKRAVCSAFYDALC